ncbi:30S ribosomal protein S8 [Candidatus Roizmanbacteria bacterium RIFCSPHIGHO2_12_FULL_44_10]|uniref:Small ribosomal subunit protein uS8 n=1 Tax=Candidatus Roizmanbacteria bacterium RIFCSPHIGHO2_12_FULL_44_10 TaxID=1802054 RepID=A0A1F7I8D9_9BACT|nr:MAG: 30S ribosomal protein S8 [Candidatus Roizmanbacteria bacterium RIFCSPHIGHO2_12_FULL_44_10]
MTSTVTDFIIRIKNGYMADRDSVDAIYSNLNTKIAEILKKRGYIKGFEVVKDGNKNSLKVSLLYRDKAPAVKGVALISKPGRRMYVRLTDIKPVLGGLGMAIISTSSGLITDKEARKKKVGGELLFKVW